MVSLSASLGWGSFSGREVRSQMLCCVAKKTKAKMTLRLEDKEMVQKSQLTACLRILTFLFQSKKWGVVSSAIPTFVIRDFITYSCQNWHVSMSTMTFQHASDHSKEIILIGSKENKATYFWNFLLTRSFLLNFNFLNIQSGFISKKFSDIGHNFFSCKNISRKNLLV